MATYSYHKSYHYLDSLKVNHQREVTAPLDAALKTKLARILACPVCRSPLPREETGELTCANCGSDYPVVDGIPVLIEPNNPLREKYARPAPAPSFIQRTMRLLPRPSDRLWTRRSRKAIARALSSTQPDEPDTVVINLGAAFGPAFRRFLAPYRTVLRMGIPHAGRVDVYGDAHRLPVLDATIDLFLSSSVVEHLHDPEKAVSEMARITRPGGMVYAEVPFLRAYHMPPVDYQRYTISGLEELFSRHGFEIVEKGICSGPFTAWVLLFQDFLIVLAPRGFKFAVRTLLSWLLQPIKYLDLLCENASWATYHACNFYYLGRRRKT